MRSLYLFDNDFKLLKAIKYEQILVLDNKKELRENELPVDRLTAQYVMKEYPHYDNVYYFGTKDANNKVIIYYLAQASDDTRDVYLEGIQLAYKELKHYIIENKRPTMNAKAMVSEILKGSDWIVGYIPNTLTLFSSFYQQTMLDGLSQIAGLFGLNFSFYVELENNKIVRKFVEARFPNYRKTLKRFTHDSNLLKVVSKIDRTDTITALIGYGKGVESGDGYGRKLTIENVEWKVANGDPVDKPLGQKYIELKDLTARIGIKQIDNSIHPLIAQKDYNDIEDDKELIKAIYKDLLLLSRDKYEYETTISDIGYVELGEVASIHNHKLGIHYEVSYFDINYNLLNIDKTKVKLGDKINKSRSERTLAAKREQEKILVELNHAITSANGKNTNFYGVNQPAIASENDLWYRDNGDGTVDLLIYKNGVWVEELTGSLFKELRADIEANTQLVNDAKLAADKAVAETEQIKADIEDLGDLSTALSQLDDAQTRITDMETQISEAIGNITADFYGNAPIPPYELHQKWYKTEYTPISDNDTGYESIKDTDNVTLDEFSNAGLFICINPKAEGQVFDWNDWKRIAVDNTDLIQSQINTLNSTQEGQKLTLDNYYSELIKKANNAEFKLVSDTVDEQGLIIGKLEENEGQLVANINDIKNTASESRQTLINLIGQNEDGTFKTAEYNKKISTATTDIQKLYKDLDPSNLDPTSTAYKLNETTKTATETKETLTNYAKKTDLTGLATETYVTNETTKTANAIKTTLLDYAKSTDLNGLATETYALTTAKTEAGKVSQVLTDYKKTNDSKIENINGRVETTEGNYTTLTQKVDGEVQKLFDVTQTVEGQTTVIKDLKGETGNMSLVEIRQNINEFSSKFINMPDNITGTVKLDSVGVPIAPYKKGNVWYKDDYNFTQGYDVIKSTDNITLDEFASAGVWVANKDSTNGVFNWNDWQRVSADSSFQLSEIYQDINKIALTVQNNDNNTKSQLLQLSNMIDMTVTKDDLIGQINTQAGNVLIRASADGKSSLLNVTSTGTYIETGIIKNAHIDDGAITRVKIGEAAIDTAKIADAAITSAKILNLDVNKVSGLTSEFVQSKWNAINSSVTITGNGMLVDGDWGGSINFTRRGQTFYDKIKGQVMGYQYGLYRNADDPLVNSQMKGIYLAAEMGYDLTLGIRKEIDNQNNAYMTIKSAGGTNTLADIWGETRLYKGIRTNNQIFYATNDTGSGIKIGAGQALDNWVTTITNAEGTAGIGFTAGGGVMIRRYDSAAGISVWKWL